jgi:membrane-bound serine protease (ClpP class)
MQVPIKKTYFKSMKKTIFILSNLTILFFAFASLGKDSVASVVRSAPLHTQRNVFIIPVEGDVEPAMAAFIARALRDAARYPDPLIILEMDSFGGRVDAAFQIVDTILNAPRGKTIAFVKTKAISAGSLIALACGELVMKHNTTIGDCAPIALTNEGAQMLGEKFQSPLRAKFRTLAKRNGFPQALAEAMVTPDMVVYKVQLRDSSFYIDSVGLADLSAEVKKNIIDKKTIVKKGQLLTMDDVEAGQLGFSKMSVESIQEMLERKQIKDYHLIRFSETWSESLVRIISKIAPILMLIGFAALYLEYKTPGLIFPGIIGALCLGLVFFSHYLVGLATYTELLILVLGALLLGIEIFVLPGFGIAGIAGISCIVIGLILSFQNFVFPSPSMPWQMRELAGNVATVVGSFVAAFIAVILFIRFGLASFSKVVRGPYLDATLQGSHADSQAIVGVKENDAGIVETPLRPSGKARIGNRVIDVVAEGDFIEKGAEIIVNKILRNKIIVARKNKNA